MSGTLYEDQYKFMIISLSFLLRMRDVADKVVKKKNSNTHFIFSNIFFSSENRAVYEMWKKYCRAGQPTVDNMAHALCVLDN